MDSSPPETPENSPTHLDSPDSRTGSAPPRQVVLSPWLILLSITAVFLIMFWRQSSSSSARVTYSFFLEQLNGSPEDPDGNVKEVIFNGEHITGEWKTKPVDPQHPEKKLPLRFSTTMLPDDKDLVPLLNKQKVTTSSIGSDWSKGLNVGLTLFVPLALLVCLRIFRRRS